MPFGNTAIVILGASGDLAQRKLIPALNLIHGRLDGEGSFVVIGSGRTAFTDTAFRRRFDISPEFSKRLFYHRGIPGLKDFIAEKGSFDRVVFFMALPPKVYGSTAGELAAVGFGSEATLIIEKPFGSDLESAMKLDRELSGHFNESQIFRIDHYLAKEAVQNILVFRFANALFYPVWNSRYIESIQINAFETEGIGERAGYFDQAGIVRDMVQNHLMQLLCLITMEAPVSLDAEEIRAQKISVLKAVEIHDCARWQYEGYREEKGVAPGSTTETYAMLKLSINNFRWAGMPVYIRTGKALDRRGTEIGARFKRLPKLLFNRDGTIPPNRAIFKIQPAEGIIIDLATKIPGAGIDIATTNMAFCYRDSFAQEIPEAYQRLLLDAIKGDRTLFVSAEETEMSWRKLEPFLDAGEVRTYRRGKPPAPEWEVDWIDFDMYKDICG
ncbi:MAG: glucose-6-phosphate dehydrogenase [Chitinivibrionales bacterium]|nr:glucose-6-phosphate dehydrogenase [Chitinivibrionales bacterium]MBD3395257.1 glucose-6-phosphate dehydrogenase [Chitinivibrionales bacterium]